MPIDKIEALADEEIQAVGHSRLESGRHFRAFLQSWTWLLDEAKSLGDGVLVLELG